MSYSVGGPYRARIIRHGLTGLAATTLFLLLTSGAQAAKGRAESRENSAGKARRACLAGDLQTGMTILSDLFVKTKDPAWIYNQGRCFEQNGKYEEAVSRFEEYLRLTKDSTGKDRDEAQEHLAECQGKLVKAAPITPQPELPPPLPPPPPPQSVVQVSESRPAPAPEQEGRALRIAGITVGIVGVAALGGGLAFNLLANQMAKDLNKVGGYDQDKASTHSTYQTLTWVGYGVGGACVATGALLYFLGSRGADSSAVALVPSFAPGQAGVNLQGAF
jgi:hypothetical protein